ncbi:hypothetical protein HYFRA_00013033 [Hymenoscyphus fraxineus]|uniref:Ureidoglycolate hydrolase n=1 Tax=Hymenoscyphus fraxineus TaxID=746836 RepID=A0A9N9L4Y7_9HELO|nr:hypothetical protein HYFRA_00013033 [Hymenoscyphus fraxineus]
MTLIIPLPFQSKTIPIEPLNQNAFSQFGTVISNPSPSLTPHPHLQELPPQAVLANQGSALKYLDITHMRNFYNESTTPGKAVMNMFVCAPRSLLSTPDSNGSMAGHFKVEILERHPFTTQTFIPLGLSSKDSQQCQYLVIVAPSLKPSEQDESLPVPTPTTANLENERYPGRGLPDLNGIKAFLADGSQAVTYGAGTWHAPMVVIGEKPIDFVVVQFANGVGIEDCQEVEWKEKNDDGGLLVAIPQTKAKL